MLSTSRVATGLGVPVPTIDHCGRRRVLETVTLVTRTLRLRIAPSTNSGELAARWSSAAEWQRAVSATPWGVRACQPLVVRQRPDAGQTGEVRRIEQSRLSWAESVRTKTEAH